jgi:hypothetical protein
MKLKVGINASGVALEAVPFETVRKALAIILAQGSCFLAKRPEVIDRHVLAGLRVAFINGALFDFGTIPQDPSREFVAKADAAWKQHALAHPYPQWAAVVRLCDDRNIKLTYLFAINCNPEGLGRYTPEAAKLNKVFSFGLWAVSSKATTFLAAADVALHPADGQRPIVNAMVSHEDSKQHAQAIDVFIQVGYLLSRPGITRSRLPMAGPQNHQASGQHRTYMLLNTEPYVTKLALGSADPARPTSGHVGHGHGSPSPHDRRGHTRTLRSGRVVMVKPAKIGQGATRRRHYETEISP